MGDIAFSRFVVAYDGFYEDPRAVHRAALAATYHEPEDATGWRSDSVYHEPGVRRRLERLLGLRITRWDTDPEEGNGVFYLGFRSGRKKEEPAVHYDHPSDDVTCVVYLTPGLPADCGTSLWLHRATALAEAPTRADARRLGRTRTELIDHLERDSLRRERWIETDRIGYRANRIVAYPSGMMHSATRHHGAGRGHGRIYQTFRVGVDWSSLRAAPAVRRR